MRTIFLSLFLLSSAAAASPSRLDLALDAHARADYAAARAALLPLAARGSPVAESLLGGMAARGQGVDANPATAVAWWLRAARRGYGPAQLALARALADGRGVSADPAEAWLWASRAARAPGPVAVQARRVLAGLAPRLSPQDRQRLRRQDKDLPRWP
jgi:TPR repeat protein